MLQKYLRWMEHNYHIKKRVTYDYSLVKACELLKEGANLSTIDLNKTTLVIVDEFQDTNPVQMKIVQALLQRNPEAKLAMVGDFDQNIYEWRGTDLTYLS